MRSDASIVCVPGESPVTWAEFAYAITDPATSSQLPPSKHRCTWWSPVLGSPIGTLASNVTVNGSETVAPSPGDVIESDIPPLPVLAPALEHAAAKIPIANTAPSRRTRPFVPRMVDSFPSVNGGYYRERGAGGSIRAKSTRERSEGPLRPVVPPVATPDPIALLTPSDEALLAGMGSGDAAAAAEFVRRFERRVFGLTLSILRDRGAAEEAAQETFVRAWRHASSFDPRRGKVAAWLLTIARNAALNMLPSRGIEPVDPDDLVGLVQTRGERGGTDADEDGSLREAVRRLPEEQRRPLVLAAFYGYTAQEMSDLDGVPLGTVKSRVRAGLLKLRTELGVGDGT